MIAGPNIILALFLGFGMKVLGTLNFKALFLGQALAAALALGPRL